MSGAELISKERQRQIEEERYTLAHDDGHDHGELAEGARAYLTCAIEQIRGRQPELKRVGVLNWPFYGNWKPKDAKHNLVVAGAMIAAELDRLQRLEAEQSQT